MPTITIKSIIEELSSVAIDEQNPRVEKPEGQQVEENTHEIDPMRSEEQINNLRSREYSKMQ